MPFPTLPPTPHRARCLVSLLWLLPMLALADCEVNGKPVNPANGNTTQGLTGIMRCKERDTGQLQREQELRDGKFVGLVRFYEKGQLVREHSVNENGNLEGRLREFGPNGQVLREATYRNGDETGLSRAFHPSGRLRRVALHDPATRSELAIAEFTATGQLRDLRCADRPVLAPAVDDAALCGFTSPSDLTFHRDDGRPTDRVRLERGQRVRQVTLDENATPRRVTETQGQRRVEQQFSATGVKRREVHRSLSERGSVVTLDQTFAESGQLTLERRWNDNSELLSERRFHLNGQLQRQEVYSGPADARQLTTTDYDDAGSVVAERRYRTDRRGRQLPVGAHIRRNGQGVVVSESLYDDAGRLQRVREWDDTGVLVRDDEVFEDGSRKAFSR